MALATMESSDGNSLTISSLRVYLKQIEWKDLDDEESTLSTFLLSSAFKRQGLEDDEIDRLSLSLYAILNCHGSV